MAELEMLLFEQAPNAMLYFDKALNLSMMNLQAERLWHRSRVDALLRAVTELGFEGLEVAQMRQAMSENVTLRPAAQQVSIGEVNSYMDVTYTPIAMEGEQGILVTVGNVSHEHELERQLRDSRDELQAVLDNIPDSVTLMQPDGLVRYNKTMGARQSGGEAEQFEHLADFTVRRLRYPDGREMAVEDYPIARATRGETFASEQIITTTPSGSDRYLSVSGGYWRDTQGNIRLGIVTARDITREYQLERELEASRDELKEVLDNLPDAVILVEPSGKVRYRNNEHRRIININEDEPIRAIADHAHLYNYDTSRMAAAKFPIIRAVQGERFTDAEVSLIVDGETRYYSVSGASVRDEHRQVRLAMTVTHDVTKVRQLEQEAEAGHKELQLILDNLPDAVVLIEPDGTIRYRNQAHRRMLGEAGENELPHYQMVQLLRPNGEEVPEDELPVGRVRSGEDFADLELSFTNAAGERFLVSYNGIILRDSEGQPSVGVVVGHDLTAIRRAEEAGMHWLQEAERERTRLLIVLEQMPEGVIIATAPEGNVVLLNRTAARLYGLDEELIPRIENRTLTHYETFTPDGQPLEVAARPLFRALRGETVAGAQVQIKRADGTVCDLLVNAAPIVEQDEGKERISGAVSVFQDVSALVALEKLKDEFISITSHELRTPITSIKGFAEILARKLARLDVDDSAHADLSKPVNVILEQAGRMTSLVNNLLDVSRMAAGQFEVDGRAIDLSQLLSHAAEVNSTISALPIQLELPDEPALAYGDEQLIGQVMNNLLANAAKYSPRGGAITIRLAGDGDAWKVSVSDQGIGLSREAKSRLFERFYRSETGRLVAPGLGLGLYIAKNIVEGFGGRIWAESKGEGQGSTFCFTLPRVEE